ncbi:MULTISPECIES: response regulator transcription factor [Sphingobium]|jgi:DNA-binding response OmpR family regulator|uniref:Response regulator transcription factor n=1 Tax=Sphingobium limneticum TaxID=1007511 RepID=A0A5J5IA79_9SPHN|nr:MULTISPECIES: response regulator transcription factor [Sphingobium]KAA9020219.1 response regulator transcription factor [Sphingobium limneticum]KAA9021302.1 response regulator transcription factor [Sphingobium limneticum]KAA9033663.1 response regulator transcription factor [Sphingobium limneticum]MBU0930981.1 response regulator transcription factor [Alphaproteobacteria bacterium]
MRVAQAAGAGLRILLVEDDPGIGRFVHRGLTAEGYAVEWQTLGRRAQSRLASGQFHAAILDLGLPDADGADLCREARAKGNDLPICMLTARAELEDRLDGFRCGADDYLTKPFSFDELLARLNVMIRRSAVQSQDRIVLDGLVVDVRGRAARVEEVSLPLSRREFDLLHCLARQAGQVVTRGQILDEVWGQDAEVTENAVDVYVGYLRKHLIRHDGAPDLSTVRGVGFLLRHRTKA